MSDVPKLVSGSILRLKGRAPFFAVLALHSRWIADPAIDTACTDGRTVRFNPDFLGDLKAGQRDFVVAHEVAHLALRHVGRRREREPRRWNVACDVVVNGLLEAAGLQPVPGCIRDRKLEKMRAEDVYARLKKVGSGRLRKLGSSLGSGLRDLGDAPTSSADGGNNDDDGPAPRSASRDDAWWRDALRKAVVVQRQSQQGIGALGSLREVSAILQPQLNWRTLLWRHLVRTPTDYTGYDRRFIHQGLYVDELDGEKVQVLICIDTSGSITTAQLDTFVGELRGILAAHPQLDALLWYADTKLYGPWPLTDVSELPAARGGGGTDLCPFFKAAARLAENEFSATPPVAIYLTDGFGPIPKEPPALPVLWVVPEGGLDEFPWGEMARLGECA